VGEWVSEAHQMIGAIGRVIGDALADSELTSTKSVWPIFSANSHPLMALTGASRTFLA